MKGAAFSSIKKLIVEKIASLVKKQSKTKTPSIQSSKRTKQKSVTYDYVKGGPHSSAKKLTAEKIAILVKKLSIENPKTKSPSI